jgi:N-terminal domain of reverse transcriptase
MTEAPEPEDKLDATTPVVVNGPKDAPFDWHAIDWRQVEEDVRRLRQRIFTASKGGGPETGSLPRLGAKRAPESDRPNRDDRQCG